MRSVAVVAVLLLACARAYPPSTIYNDKALKPNVKADKCEFCINLINDFKEFLLIEGKTAEEFFEKHCSPGETVHDWKKLVCEAFETAVEELTKLIELKMDAKPICTKFKAC